MAQQWYYVDPQKNERIGPINQEDLLSLIRKETLQDNHYVWTKGFDNWKLIKDVPELQVSHEEPPLKSGLVPPPKAQRGPDWRNLDVGARCFYIRIGDDRGAESGVEYGPFKGDELKQLKDENRINDETLYFVQGMEYWEPVAKLPLYRDIFHADPPAHIQERRKDHRKPFVARMFFHDQKNFFEGVCRDISIGGMQVMVPNFPGKVGEVIDLNVHPQNTDFHFVAAGEIVRFLEGKIGFSFRFKSLNQEAQKAIEEYLKES